MAMFIYTRAATLKIYDDLKKFLFIFSASMQALYIGYLIYALAVGAGLLFVNIALMALSASYLTFIIVQQVKQKKLPKRKSPRYYLATKPNLKTTGPFYPLAERRQLQL